MPLQHPRSAVMHLSQVRQQSARMPSARKPLHGAGGCFRPTVADGLGGHDAKLEASGALSARVLRGCRFQGQQLLLQTPPSGCSYDASCIAHMAPEPTTNRVITRWKFPGVSVKAIASIYADAIDQFNRHQAALQQ